MQIPIFVFSLNTGCDWSEGNPIRINSVSLEKGICYSILIRVPNGKTFSAVFSLISKSFPQFLSVLFQNQTSPQFCRLTQTDSSSKMLSWIRMSLISPDSTSDGAPNLSGFVKLAILIAMSIFCPPYRMSR